MFARLVTLNLEPGNLPAASSLADAQGTVMRRLRGFRDVTFLHNEDTSEYGSFSVWETKRDAEAVSDVAELQVKETFKKLMKGRPSVRIFEVYSAKG